jgi:hypothetical protein
MRWPQFPGQFRRDRATFSQLHAMIIRNAGLRTTTNGEARVDAYKAHFEKRRLGLPIALMTMPRLCAPLPTTQIADASIRSRSAIQGRRRQGQAQE